MRSLVVIAALLAAVPAAAQDFSAEAKSRMRLSFDLDEVEGMLASPAPASMSPDTTTPHPHQLSALPLEPNSEVATVTVYRDRALVTRELTEVVGDDGAVVFEGLPLGLAAASLHAAVPAGDGRIVGVELESGWGEVEETARIEEVRERMLDLTEELGSIQDRIEALLAQRAYLRTSLIGGSEGPAPGLGTVRQTLDYLGSTEADIAAQLRVQEQRAQELDDELSPLLVKLDNPLATGMRVRVDLDAPASRELTVRLDYQVHGAGWSPSYNARLAPAGDQVELEYFGVVRQTTGEDWSDAALLLSTASPSSTGGLPTLEPWVLGWNDTLGLEAGRGYYDEAGAGFAAARGDGVLASEMSADVQGSGAVVFAIPGTRTVAGDGSSQRLPVGTQAFAAEVELATVPKRVPQVFRRATIRYDGEIPMLPGALASHVGSEYVGSGPVDAVVPGEALELSFGADDRIKVTRQLVSRKKDRAGRRAVRYTFAFRIEVANFSDASAVVEVLDQLPVSELDKVEVQVLSLSGGLVPRDDDAPGTLRWRPGIAPGERTTLDLSFSVTAPDDIADTYLRSMELLF